MPQTQIRHGRLDDKGDIGSELPGHDTPMSWRAKAVDYVAVVVFVLWCALLLFSWITP